MFNRVHNLGVVLAIVAGLFNFAMLMWPISPPQVHGELGAAWGLLIVVVSAGYLASAFLSRERPGFGKLILFIGAVVQGASGIGFLFLFRDLYGPPWGLFAALFDIVPATVAIIAGVMIGPIEERVFD